MEGGGGAGAGAGAGEGDPLEPPLNPPMGFSSHEEVIGGHSLGRFSKTNVTKVTSARADIETQLTSS